ncbi:zinc finger protein 644-like [Conger conger]|uniref:zinc finger protein 644-like n=1 Tax=Conger conger TaxID=82655 RepID=UPI002A5A466E|nr:zinc finger protein 644-like [Conger conger]
MADLKQRAKEKKDADSVSDRADITQESLKNRMSSLRKSTSRLCQLSRLPLGSSEKPLNGAQPALFVCGSVPDVDPDGSPTHALANGPGSHATLDELCASNNGGVSLSETAPGQAGKVSQPSSEPKADSLKNVPGILPKGSATQVCAKATVSKGDESKSEALDGLSADNQDEMLVSQIRAPKGIGARRIWDFDMESSESSSDDYESANDLNWDPQKEFMQFLWNDHDDPDLEKKLETAPQPAGGRRRKRKMDMVVMVDPSEKLYDEKLLADVDSDFEEGVPNAISGSNVHSRRKRPKLQSSLSSCETYPSDTVEAIKQLMLSAPSKKTKDDGLREVDADLGSEEEPSFFPCTKCNVNFKEKKHLHRHMMHHLDGGSQFRHMNVPRPFICRECGRSFRDRNSLLKHMTIHQERREKLMEEIKGLNELKDEGRTARLQCPQCVFGTNCPNTFVQHAKTHEKDKRYYCCEECNFMAVTEHELEHHLSTAHRVAQYVAVRKNDRSQENRTLVAKKNNVVDSSSLLCKICPYRTQSKNALKKHVELIHRQPYVDSDSPAYESTNNYATPVHEPHKFAGKSQKTDVLDVQPKLSIEKQPFRKRTELPFRSDDIADLIRKKKTTQKARKGFNSSLAKWGFGSSANRQTATQQGSDKEGKSSLQQAEKIDITTGLPYVEDGYKDSDQGYGVTFSANSKKPNSLPSCYKQPTPKTEKPNNICYPGCNSDKGKGGGEDHHGKSSTVEPTIKGKSPSKRKMSTPYHNTMDKAPALLLPKREQTPKRHETPEDMEECDGAYDFDDYASEATSNFLDNSENEQNPYARSYFIRRQRFTTKEEGGSPSDLPKKDCDWENGGEPVQKLVVKEECIETEVCQEDPEADAGPHSDPLQDFEMSPFGSERKSCPYCPAQFESGVGLSNHVRGHLHRVGLSYNARHVVSPEQVASQDRRPRIRRKITSIRRIKKAHKTESQTEHTCPLCGGWFDTKTGLSNHVRGHLKRIGKTITSTSKSPLCILNEMMQDEEEYRNILQVLNKKQFLSRPFVSQKFAGSDGLFLSPTGVPVKIQHIGQDGKPWGPAVTSGPEEESVDKEPAGTKPGVKAPNSSTLIELLKKKKLDEEIEKNRSQTARKCVSVSPSKERSIAAQPVKTESGWPPEKNELNKKVCIHCNTTFPSAVSLSNHLRAYARRKRVALLEGTTYDCKQKKPRSRPGSKKKMFSVPHAADEIYRLTCRFCDLVFQGPLSVQEDWIKHLQRHIMNTSVPRTGAGMVEVTSLPKDPSSPERQTPPPPATQVAS